MEETERSLHDAIMIVRRATKNDAVVAGKYSKKEWKYRWKELEKHIMAVFNSTEPW